MRRLFLGLVAVAALVACNDSTPTGMRPPGVDGIRSAVGTDGTLDENINALIAEWPKSPANAITSQWTTVKRLYAAGDLAAAQAKLFELVNYILKKTPGMLEQEDESRDAAAARLIQNMLLYVYSGGPDTPPPVYIPGADNTVGNLTPVAPLTLVTPSGDAGVQFQAGSVGENRTVFITQNPTQWGPCDGPLLTELCQYPLFYDIASFPDGPLLLPAKAAICHPEVDTNRGPIDEATHDRLRLAHPKPSAGDEVEGGIIRDTPPSEENIEILPLVSQDFVICEGVVYGVAAGGGLLQRGVRLASALASRVGRLLTPRSAYAIDQGGGGEFMNFGSPFNNVDPGIPNPIITLESTEISGSSTQYNIPVTNWASYPAAMFVASPSLPPCGLNTSASRTWVEIYNGDTNSRVYGFCALGAPSDLQLIWVAFPTAGTQPCSLYIELVDRLTETTYTSNVISTGACLD